VSAAVRRRLASRGDDGNAVLEFLFLGVLLLLPLMYVMLTVFEVQKAAFAVSAASREAGRAYATGSTLDEAKERALLAAEITLADHGLELDPDLVVFPDGATFGRGDRVVVTVRYQAPLPLVSAFFSDAERPAIDVTGEHTTTVDEFRGS
jgi:hypothetical protein